MATAQLVVSTAEGALSVWIEDIVVSATHRNNGIGKQLIAHILDWSRLHGATRAQLLVDLDNEQPVIFYDHIGWENTHLGVRKLCIL